MVGANLLPVLWFAHLPAADGPSHVYNASLIARYFFHPSDPIRRLVEFNTSLPPNLLAHGVLAAFMAVMSPGLAERALVAAYVVLLPLSLRYCMRAVSADTRGVEFLGLAVVFNSHLHWGFYNFLAGLVTFLFALGYWLRIRTRDASLVETASMAALATLVYFSHAVPLIELWLTMGLLWAVAAVRTRSWRSSELRSMVLVSIPPACLYLHYVLTKPRGVTVATVWPTLRYSAAMLVRLFPLSTYTPAERLASLGLAALLAAAIGLAWAMWRPRAGENDALYVSAMLAGLVFIAPTQAAGGTLITPRLVYAPLFLALVWLSSVRWSPTAVAAFVIAGIGLTLAGHVARWPIYERYDARMRSVLALAAGREAGRVDFFQAASANTTVDLDSHGTPHLSAGVWGYVAADQHGLLPSDYEARLGYFPFVYRSGADPQPYAISPPAACSGPGRLIDEHGYRSASGLHLDAQMIWTEDDEPAQEDCVRRYSGHIVSVQQASGGKLFWFDVGD
jgi:hypothetical protein